MKVCKIIKYNKSGEEKKSLIEPLKLKEYLRKVDIESTPLIKAGEAGKPRNFRKLFIKAGEDDKPRNSNKPRNSSRPRKVRFGWPIKIFILTLSLSLMFSVISEIVLTNANVIISILVIVVLLFIASFFDALGVAVSACNINAFINEQYKDIKGVNQAKFLINNADKVASFCCDIIGDTCGILSGSAGAAIAIKLVSEASKSLDFFVSVVITSLITGLTVFCKALGKNFAINKSATIIFFAGRLLSSISLKKRKQKK